MASGTQANIAGFMNLVYQQCQFQILILALKEVTITKSTVVKFFWNYLLLFTFFGCGYMCDILRRSGNIKIT